MPDIRSSDVLRSAGTFSTVEGVLFILGGILLIITPIAFAVGLTMLTGIILIVAGIVGVVRLASESHDQHGGGAGFIGPILAGLAGVVLLLDPTLSAAFIVSVLGAFLLVSGGMQIAAACGMHGRDHWGLVLASGIATVLLGAVVFLQPGIALFVFGIFAGVQLVFIGFYLIRAGGEFRRLGAKR